MLGLRRAEVIFDLTGVFICCLGEGYGCFFVISRSCCNECAYMKHWASCGRMASRDQFSSWVGHCCFSYRYMVSEVGSTGPARQEHWKIYARNKQRGATMANFQIPPPDILELTDGSTASNWWTWVAAWKNYTLATKLDNEDEVRQVATLLAVIEKKQTKCFELSLGPRQATRRRLRPS